MAEVIFAFLSFANAPKNLTDYDETVEERKRCLAGERDAGCAGKFRSLQDKH
jgi:hypothetical protein